MCCNNDPKALKTFLALNKDQGHVIGFKETDRNKRTTYTNYKLTPGVHKYKRTKDYNRNNPTGFHVYLIPPVYADHDFVYIAKGCYHFLGLKSDGTVWAWGYNFYAQLGDGTTTDRHIPVKSNLTELPESDQLILLPVFCKVSSIVAIGNYENEEWKNCQAVFDEIYVP